MENEIIEELLAKLQSTANLLRGTYFDNRIPLDAREAFKKRAAEIDELCEKHEL